jgi:hypothetical protein
MQGHIKKKFGGRPRPAVPEKRARPDFFYLKKKVFLRIHFDLNQSRLGLGVTRS